MARYLDPKIDVPFKKIFGENKELINGYHDTLPEEFILNELIHSAIKICEESALSASEYEAYERAKEEAQWQDSIKAIEDEAIESRIALAKSKKTIEERDKALVEKDKALVERDTALAEKDTAIEVKDKTIENQKQEIEELRRQLKLY
jgi:septal ring factor EnvC (AmiA/AmiB activator)